MNGTDSTPQPEDEGQVRADRGGWISGPCLSEEQYQLAGLRARYPRWSFWKGKYTGSWWACPPPGVLTLVNADDLDRLEAMVADIESWDTGP